MQDNYMESAEESQVPAWRSPQVQAVLDGIKAANERACEARNAARWKAERDPVAYEAQKARQRDQYQPRDGVAVRSYEKITAPTKADREAEAAARHAQREAKRYAGMTPAEKQAKSDQIADKAWLARKRERGIPEDIIQASFIARLQEREAARAAKARVDQAEAEMRALPHWNIAG